MTKQSSKQDIRLAYQSLKEKEEESRLKFINSLSKEQLILFEAWKQLVLESSHFRLFINSKYGK